MRKVTDFCEKSESSITHGDSRSSFAVDTVTVSAKQTSSRTVAAVIVLVLLVCGIAFWWFVLRKKRPDTRGSADLDDYDFGDEEDEEPDEDIKEDEDGE